ncbi:hypothetical protein [Mesorhizobium sp. M0977]
MIDGILTGRQFADYFIEEQVDGFNASTVINVMAELVASYALSYYRSFTV